MKIEGIQQVQPAAIRINDTGSPGGERKIKQSVRPTGHSAVSTMAPAGADTSHLYGHSVKATEDLQPDKSNPRDAEMEQMANEARRNAHLSCLRV